MRKKIVPVIIAAIIKDKNKFLMTKRVHLDPEDYSAYHNAWQLPGGGIEFGERPEETLHREIKEELGTDIEIIALLPKIYTRMRKNWQGIFIVYLCRLKNPKAKVKLNDEASQYRWYTPEKAAKLKTLSGGVEMMRDAASLFRKISALFTRKFELFSNLKGRAAAAAVQPPPPITLGLRPRKLLKKMLARTVPPLAGLKEKTQKKFKELFLYFG